MKIAVLLLVIVAGAVCLVATFFGVVRGEIGRALLFFAAASVCGLLLSRMTTSPRS